jgi:MFS transporter, DHA2 family, multidrug resistance protein
VTGVVQLLMAPVAVALEQRADARLLTAFGFALFAIGLGMSAFQTPQTDYNEMFWPQVLRGLAIMFCLLPPTRLALGQLAAAHVPDASGVFNLMRNLGGAIGFALIDTVIFSRTPAHGVLMLEKLQAGDVATARFVGVPMQAFAARSPGPFDADMSALLQPLIEKAALTQAINEAWILVAVLTVLALICVPFAKASSPKSETQPH